MLKIPLINSVSCLLLEGYYCNHVDARWSSNTLSKNKAQNLQVSKYDTEKKRKKRKSQQVLRKENKRVKIKERNRGDIKSC